MDLLTRGYVRVPQHETSYAVIHSLPCHFQYHQPRQPLLPHVTSPPAPHSRSRLSALASLSDPVHSSCRTCAPIPSARLRPQTSTHGCQSNPSFSVRATRHQTTGTALTFARVALGSRAPSPRMTPCASASLAPGPHPAAKGEPIQARDTDTSQSHRSHPAGPHPG